MKKLIFVSLLASGLMLSVSAVPTSPPIATEVTLNIEPLPKMELPFIATVETVQPMVAGFTVHTVAAIPFCMVTETAIRVGTAEYRKMISFSKIITSGYGYPIRFSLLNTGYKPPLGKDILLNCRSNC